MYNRNRKTNFINQIHENLENVDYSFSIQYNKKDNFEDMNDGILIIGEESIAKKQNTNLVIEWEDNDFPKEYYLNKFYINNTENTES